MLLAGGGGGVGLRRGGRRGRKGKFESHLPPKENVSSSHAPTRRTSHCILSDFDLEDCPNIHSFSTASPSAPFPAILVNHSHGHPARAINFV